MERILAEARSACQNLSLFGGGKLVWINEANFLNQTKTGAAQGSKEALEAAKPFLENLGESKLIISACPIHRNHIVHQVVKKQFNLRGRGQTGKGSVSFRRLVQETAGECGVDFASGAVEFLAGKIGGHSRLGVEETRKLAAYLGQDGGPITEELITELVPDFGEGDFFEASEAFFSHDLKWALDAIERHFFHAKDARPLLATLQNRNRLLIQLRVLSDGGELDPSQRLSKESSNSWDASTPPLLGFG